MKKKLFFSTLLSLSVSASFFAQTDSERRIIAKGYDQKALKSLSEKFSAKSKSDKAEAIAYARKSNIPVLLKAENGSTSELMRIDENGTPIYYTNNNVDAAKSTRADHLNSGGSLGLDLNGENMIVGVWDGGSARTTHVEFGNRITVKDNAIFNSDSNHATHVAGTIAATGVWAKAKGMAPKSKIDDYEWNSDKGEMTEAAAAGLLVSNHSYGISPNQIPDYYFGAYLGESADWDTILFNAPHYLAVKAAGNDGKNEYFVNFWGYLLRFVINEAPMEGQTDLYDKLTGSATSKNVLVVANAQDAQIDTQGKLLSVAINDGSSQGPTDDLRIKPDIAGNGTSVFSPVAFNGTANSNTTYDTYTGTSMASPNVSGSLILVQQYHKNIEKRYMLGAELKGLALHVADDAGVPGPDAMFGWGLLNAKKMIEIINEKGKTAIIENKTLNNNATETLTVNSDGTTPLVVSISWYDRAGNIQTSNELNSNSIKRLVNNLDLKVIRKSDNTVYLPWVLTSRSTNKKAENNNDNFERIDLGVVPAGEYTIEISHKGTLVGNSQNYSLIVTGKKEIQKSEISRTLSNSNTITTNVSIHPNPAEKEITITNVKDGVVYVIYDLTGKTIQQATLEGGNINVSSLVSGSYLLVIDNKSYKFIKK